MKFRISSKVLSLFFIASESCSIRSLSRLSSSSLNSSSSFSQRARAFSSFVFALAILLSMETALRFFLAFTILHRLAFDLLDSL